MKKWESLEEVFRNVEKDCRYVILRSYEHLHEKSFLGSGKDIDILCENPKEFLQAICAEVQSDKDDGFHYKIVVGEKNIPIDIIPSGVGYYCQEWEKHMLKCRRQAENGKWYVLEKKDYCFSLLYHVLIHKAVITEKDIYKCQEVFKRYRCGLPDNNKLNKYMGKYMKVMKYQYTVPIVNDMELYVNRENFLFSMTKQKREYIVYFIRKYIETIRGKIRWILWKV